MRDLLKNRWARWAAGVAAAAATVLGAVWSLAGDRAGAMGAIRTHTTTLSDHETRLRSIEKDLPAIRTDVSWSRETMEGNHPSP